MPCRDSAAVNGDASGEDGGLSKPVKKRKILEPEYPMRVSDRGNKGMASSTFLTDWLSTHYEPKDETEGEVVSKVTLIALLPNFCSHVCMSVCHSGFLSEFERL